MIPRIREVHLRNFRSIRQAVVRLSDFTVLVGPNGSGKSNFMDALAFVRECLASSIEAALRDRGGLSIRYGLRENDDHAGVGFRLVIDLGSGRIADYAFELAWRDGGVEVEEERCVISSGKKEAYRFQVKNGAFVVPIPGLRASIEADRLALYAASAVEEFRPVYEFLVGMNVFSIQPDAMRVAGDRGTGIVLDRDGGNGAAVLKSLATRFPDRSRRVQGLLQALVPGIEAVGSVQAGHLDLLVFTERGDIYPYVMPLFPSDVSDGTLRMLGLLLAAYQPVTPTVMLIEEPEATIHPAAADIVMSVLLDAAKRSQVLITTHSPDVLDYKSLPEGSVRVVTKTARGTVIAPVANSSREAIRQRLYSPGELLRADELNPDFSAAESLSYEVQLFGNPVYSPEGGD